MNNTRKLFLKIISDYMNGMEFFMPSAVEPDWDEFLELAKIHRVGGILYAGIGKHNTNIPESVKKSLELAFYTAIMLYQRKDKALQTVVNHMNEGSIKHVLFKGAELVHLYPNPELRSMSDYDILIKGEDGVAVHEFMLKEGAEFVPSKSNEKVRVYKLENVTFEIHSMLVANEKIIGTIKYYEYFQNAIEQSYKVEGSTYYLNKEYNFLYIIFHIVKHFYNNGCGVRMFLDLPVFINKYGHEMDWKYIWNELELLGLGNFTKKVFRLCDEWFGDVSTVTGWKLNDCLNRHELELLEDFIMDAGIYGFVGRNQEASKIKKMYKETPDTDNSKINYIKGMIKLAFPSNESMRQRSDWYREKPSILLPIAYAERAIKNSKKRGGFIRLMKLLGNGRKDIIEKDMILIMMDLERYD